jgi:hypothetical protein
MAETKFLSKVGLKTLVENLKSYIQSYTSDNTVIIKGDLDNSVVLKGEYNALGTNYSNKAISQVSTAIGAAVTAGLKGWYYTKVNLSKNLIWLSDTRSTGFLSIKISTTTATTPDNQSFNSGWKVGDEVTIVNDKKYDRCAKITAINGNMITLDKLPFDSSTLVTSATSLGNLNEPDEFSITAIRITDNDTTKTRTVASYDKGGIDFGGGANAVGIQTYALNIGAHAEGIQTVAYGQYSHTEGFRTEAAYAAHAEGGNTKSTNLFTHAEGYKTEAHGPNSHTEGQLTRTGGEDADRPTGNPGTKSGQNAHAEGAVTFAQGAGSHAEGGNTWASGNYSHTEGWQTRTYEEANNSHAEGFYTETTSRAEHAEGEYNKSNTNTIHSVGIGTSNTRKNAHEIMYNGKHYIYGIGGYDGTNPSSNNDVKTIIDNIHTKQTNLENSISSTNSLLENNTEQLSGQIGILRNNIGSLETALNASKLTPGINIEIIDNSINVIDTPEFTDITLKDFGIFKTGSIKDNFVFIAGSGTDSAIQINGNNYAGGKNSLAIGFYSYANADYSFAEGQYSETGISGLSRPADTGNSTDVGKSAHAEGRASFAYGNSSHAEGGHTYAKGNNSHAENWNTEAHGPNSHAEGFRCATGDDSLFQNTNANSNTSPGANAHAEGNVTVAIGRGSHSEGEKTEARGRASHAEGFHTETTKQGEHAEGLYNLSNSDTIHSVGIGTSSLRKNAHEILTNGKHYIYGIAGYDGTNPQDNNDLASIINLLYETVIPKVSTGELERTYSSEYDKNILTYTIDINDDIYRNKNVNLYLSNSEYYSYDTEILNIDILESAFINNEQDELNIYVSIELGDYSGSSTYDEGNIFTVYVNLCDQYDYPLYINGSSQSEYTGFIQFKIFKESGTNTGVLQRIIMMIEISRFTESINVMINKYYSKD